MPRQDQVATALIAILDQALGSYRCERLIRAAPSDAFGTWSGSMTIVFILEGAQHIRYCLGGEIVEDCMAPGDVLFAGPYCPWALDWRYPCQRLGISCTAQRLDMSWNCVREARKEVHIVPDLWFTSPMQAGGDTWHLMSALAARNRAVPDSALAARLPELVLISVRDHLRSHDLLLTNRMNTFEKLRNYLESHCHQPINRNTVARTFGLNPDYVTRLFREQGGKLFSHYLRDLRLRKAEGLLEQGTLPVQDVARLCGFGSSSYFIRLFRQKHHCSPRRYQE